MSLDVGKNRDTILAAWKDVLDDKTPTDWALFGYEGQTNVLCYISKGDGGIDELKDDLNSGKIMYAFLKVLDPKTSLPKCVLINWQGEGSPLVRKGTCANHVHDVANLLKGVHVTVNARTEEDVDSDIIIDKVAKSTASAYSFSQRTANIEKNSGPVGTAYKRVIPSNEINSAERDMFWQKEEEEEKRRQAEERCRAEALKNRLEMETRQRELEKNAEKESKNGNLVNQSKVESARKEAEALIAMRNFDARAIFEKNTSAGQMVNRKGSFNRDQPTSPQRDVSVGQHTNGKNADRFTNTVASTTYTASPGIIVEEESTHQPPHHQQQQEIQQIQESSKNEIQQVQEPLEVRSVQEQPQTVTAEEYVRYTAEAGFDKDVICLDDYEGLGLRAEALYDYQAADETEISFDPGDIITHIDQIDEGWWQGLSPDGTFGLFPANYVQLLD